MFFLIPLPSASQPSADIGFALTAAGAFVSLTGRHARHWFFEAGTAAKQKYDRSCAPPVPRKKRKKRLCRSRTVERSIFLKNQRLENCGARRAAFRPYSPMNWRSHIHIHASFTGHIRGLSGHFLLVRFLRHIFLPGSAAAQQQYRGEQKRQSSPIRGVSLLSEKINSFVSPYRRQEPGR